MKQHLEVPGAGHYGIFSGRRWRDVVYPQVKEFIHAGQARSKAVKAEGDASTSTRTARVSAKKTGRSPAKPAARKSAAKKR